MIIFKCTQVKQVFSIKIVRGNVEIVERATHRTQKVCLPSAKNQHIMHKYGLKDGLLY